MYRSTDNGGSWAEAGLGNSSTLSLAATEEYLFAGTGSGVCRSADNGLNWSVCDSGIPGKIVRSIVVSDTNIFAATLGKGVYLSQDNGTSWKSVNTNNMKKNIYALVISDGVLYAGTQGGVWKRPVTEMTEETAIDPRQRVLRKDIFSLHSLRRRNSGTTVVFTLAHTEFVSLRYSTFQDVQLRHLSTAVFNRDRTVSFGIRGMSRQDVIHWLLKQV